MRGSPISNLRSSFVQVSIRLVQKVCLVFVVNSILLVMHLSTNGRDPVEFRCNLAKSWYMARIIWCVGCC